MLMFQFVFMFSLYNYFIMDRCEITAHQVLYCTLALCSDFIMYPIDYGIT